MPHKVQKLCVELTINRISCPGVWLRSNNELYLSICLFGKYQRTSLAEPVFPAIFMERFRFEKVFYLAIDPAEVSDMLEDEDVLFELVQLAPEEPDGAVLLASFQRNVRDFLYPYPQLLPSYGSADREVLMDKSWDFPGIAPRIEFGSHAKLKEVKIPKHYYNGAGRNSSLKARRSMYPRSPSPKTYIYPDSEEDCKGYQEPTVSSISRSRSMSPSQRAKLRSLNKRPPFQVRKVDDSVIMRKPGATKTKKRTKSAQEILRSSSRTRACDKVTGRVCTPDYYSDEESDVEYMGGYRRRMTQSIPDTVLPPRRPISPVTYRQSLRERYLDNELDVEAWRRRRVERAEKALTESLVGSYRTRSVLSYDSLDELADEFDRSRLLGY